MRHFFKLLVCAMVLTLATQAQAAFVLDFSGFAGGSVVNTGDPLASVSFAGTSTITQQLGADGVLSSGDPFSQAPLQDFSVGYTDTNNIFTVNLGPNGQMLIIKAPTLTGQLTTQNGPNSFFYTYDVPASGIEIYYDNDTISATKIADATLTAPSGGLNSDTLASGFFNTGTFHLYATLDTLLSGIIYNNGTDLADLVNNGIDVLAQLDGHINLNNSEVIVNPDGTTAIRANFNNGGEFTISAVPEPGTMLLMGLGTMGMAFIRRRARSRG